ncbi:MAG: helix-turn-helix transcriptional regulator [bacterium]|nr:helix-turn-helix transcriptional regulator [bacterium]
MSILKKKRDAKKMTIEDVARAIGISGVAAGKHERGDIKLPGEETRKKYAKFYETAQTELFPQLNAKSGVITEERIRQIFREEFKLCFTRFQKVI